jgi:HlyD family secretion protein
VRAMKYKVVLIAVLVVATTLTLRAFYNSRGGGLPAVTAESVTRGPIVQTISATGSLGAVTTVQVGSQVSGAIESLHADFNSIVRRGQLLARLDQSLYRAAIDQAQANLVRAQADLERLQMAAEDADARAARMQQLWQKELIAAVELEAAEVAARSAQAQIRSGQAQVTQARAALTHARVNLDKTVITSPIDGIVIARNVDVGQTVAASLQAPVLFEIAADLAEMQLQAHIDEADLGAITEGQPVRFTVDAYPGQSFEGRVEQVRLNPRVEQNVVTYAAIISAPNPQFQLLPGMTAIVTVEVARRDDALRVPAAALRFRPTEEVLAAFGREPLPPGRIEPDAGTVWVWRGGDLEPVRIRTGLADATYVEVLDGDLSPGVQVATRAALAGAGTSSPGGGSNPLMPTGPQRR